MPLNLPSIPEMYWNFFNRTKDLEAFPQICPWGTLTNSSNVHHSPFFHRFLLFRTGLLPSQRTPRPFSWRSLIPNLNRRFPPSSSLFLTRTWQIIWTWTRTRTGLVSTSPIIAARRIAGQDWSSWTSGHPWRDYDGGGGRLGFDLYHCFSAWMVTNAGIGAGTATSHSTSSHSRMLRICGAIVGYTFGYTFDIGRQSAIKNWKLQIYFFLFSNCRIFKFAMIAK